MVLKVKKNPVERAEQTRESPTLIYFGDMMRIKGGVSLMRNICDQDNGLKEPFLVVGRQCGEVKVSEDMLVEVCTAKDIPAYHKPLAVVAGLAMLAKEIDAIEERVESPKKRIKEIVGDFENGFRANRNEEVAKLDSIVQRISLDEPAAIEEKRKIIDEITDYITSKMDGPEKIDFKDHYAWLNFQPALERLSIDVLKRFRVHNESDELEFAKYYARLHAAFLKHVSGGGPANIIERVAENQNIPDEKKFKVIVVALYELFEQATGPQATGPRGDHEGTQDVARNEKLAKQIVDRLANPEALDKELERLEYCLRLRKAVANKIMDKQSRETFLKDPSLNYFIRGLRQLDVDALKELASTNGIGAVYVESHAKLMDRKIFGVPGRLMLYLVEQNVNKDLQAPIITTIVKQLADRTVMVSSKPGEDPRDVNVAAGKNSIDAFVALHEDPEKVRSRLVTYVLQGHE